MEQALDYFDKIYCINLPERVDRWAQAQEEFDKIGIKDRVIRIDGVIAHKSSKWLGCTTAHFNILLNTHNERILIFEDDVKFADKFDLFIPGVINDIKLIDWSMFYMGGNICGEMYQVEGRALARLTHAQSTHAYALNTGVAEQLLRDTGVDFSAKELDRVYAEEVIPRYPCYISIPMLAVQRDSFSDIEGKEVHYSSWMVERYYNNLKLKGS